MRVLDFFKREIAKGDFVVATTSSRHSVATRVGMVTRITPAGNVSIDLGADYTKYGSYKRVITAIGGRGIVIINHSDLPASFTNSFNNDPEKKVVCKVPNCCADHHYK